MYGFTFHFFSHSFIASLSLMYFVCVTLSLVTPVRRVSQVSVCSSRLVTLVRPRLLYSISMMMVSDSRRSKPISSIVIERRRVKFIFYDSFYHQPHLQFQLLLCSYMQPPFFFYSLHSLCLRLFSLCRYHSLLPIKLEKTDDYSIVVCCNNMIVNIVTHSYSFAINRYNYHFIISSSYCCHYTCATAGNNNERAANQMHM